MSDLPCTPDGDGVRLGLRVTPRAKKSAFGGLVEIGERRFAIAVKLAAPPVDGAANQALIEFLAVSLRLPRSAIRLVSGEKSRLKTVRIDGMNAETLAERLSS